MRTALKAALALASAALAVPMLLLLSVAETAEGRAFALAALAALLAAGLALARGAAGRRAAVCAGGVAVALTAFVLARAPDGEPVPGSGLGARYLEPARFHRFSPANLVPEIDQIKLTSTDLAVRVFGGALPLCLKHTLAIYREMHARDEYRALGSALHDGWANLFGAPRRGAHWWRYVPHHAPGERLPVLIFFHGFGGNYKSYLWVWKQWADAAGFAVVIPSLGFGFVTERDPRLDRMLEAWRADPELDMDRAWLCGLSNGAVPAARAAAERPGAYRGVILMSPIADGLALTGTRTWRGDQVLDLAPYPPVLALYGAHDGGITDAHVARHEARLAGLGVSMTRRCYEDMDHFLIYRAQDRYHRDLTAWIASVERARAPAGVQLEFLVDDEMLIQSLLDRGALESASTEDARAALALQNRMWSEKAPYDVLSGRWTPSALRARGAPADPAVQRFIDTVRAWPELAAVRRAAGTRRDACERQWRADRERSERFVRDLTGLSPARAYRVYVLHPAIPGSHNLGGGALRWGGREDWPHYTTVYLWHEILHDDLPPTAAGHALIQLVTDRELRRHLAGITADDGYVGHPELRAITEKLLPAWELYKERPRRSILELAAEPGAR